MLQRDLGDKYTPILFYFHEKGRIRKKNTKYKNEEQISSECEYSNRDDGLLIWHILSLNKFVSLFTGLLRAYNNNVVG